MGQNDLLGHYELQTRIDFPCDRQTHHYGLQHAVSHAAAATSA